jgi:hypothetical protein
MTKITVTEIEAREVEKEKRVCNHCYCRFSGRGHTYVLKSQSKERSDSNRTVHYAEAPESNLHFCSEDCLQAVLTVDGVDALPPLPDHNENESNSSPELGSSINPPRLVGTTGELMYLAIALFVCAPVSVAAYATGDIGNAAIILGLAWTLVTIMLYSMYSRAKDVSSPD